MSEAIMIDLSTIRQLNDYVWEIPQHGGMRVPGRVYATRELMADIRKDEALQQVANVAHLPGIVGYSLAMPDIHWGYGGTVFLSAVLRRWMRRKGLSLPAGWGTM
jgi:hypothetical protein